jgi:hypothetical protein
MDERDVTFVQGTMLEVITLQNDSYSVTGSQGVEFGPNGLTFQTTTGGQDRIMFVPYCNVKHVIQTP